MLRSPRAVKSMLYSFVLKLLVVVASPFFLGTPENYEMNVNK